MERDQSGLWIERKRIEFQSTHEPISGYRSEFDHWPKL